MIRSDEYVFYGRVIDGTGLPAILRNGAVLVLGDRIRLGLGESDLPSRWAQERCRRDIEREAAPSPGIWSAHYTS